LRLTFVSLTGVANPLKIYSFSQYRKLASNTYGHFNIIEGLMVKINDSFAFYALKMLVIIQLAVESFNIARAFHDESGTDFGKGQKGPIDRIQRDVGQDFPAQSCNAGCRTERNYSISGFWRAAT